ncbi:MAG: SDR family oxidoreductase, partial [Acetivibrio sp.]
AEAGASICITGRTASTLIDAAEEIEGKYGTDIIFCTAAGEDEEAVRGVIKKTIEHFGHLDCLINNAQASKSGVMLEDHTKEDFDLAIQTGLYATFFYMREAFPYLKESKGHIINFASGAGLAGRNGQSSYAAAKEGIRGLSRVAATEWGQHNITVNVLCPLAMTPGLEKWRDEYPKLYDQTIKDIPLRRFADSEKDIGRVCVFLASSEANYITGETIQLQGGGGLRP